MKDVTVGERNALYNALRARKYIYIYVHIRTRVHTLIAAPRDVSRRSSRQILFRKIGLPLSSTTERRQLCVGGSYRLTNTHIMRVRARLKNFRSYHPDLLLQHPISPFSLRHTRPRYPTISVYLNHAKCRRDGGYKPAPFQIYILTYDNIATVSK